MSTVVVCDDDAVARGAVSAICDDVGLEVVAETDSGADAAELVHRFGVDVLVLDLSLSDGSGERTLRTLGEAGSDAAVVVFSAYADDSGHLARLGAREVIEKPDFELLTSVLKELASSVEARAGQPDDRRLASRDVEPSPVAWRSPSGISSHHDLAHSLQTMLVGDAVIAITVVGLEALGGDLGPLLLADCRLAVARIARTELRVQDLLHEAPEIDGVVALLRGGDARAGGAAWSRIAAAVRDARVPGEVKGAAGRVDTLGAKDAVARSVGALRDARLGSPSFLSV